MSRSWVQTMTPQSRRKQRRGKPNRGQWKPGQSGNPGGRPKEVAEVREAARQHTPEAIRTLVTLMRKGKPDRARAAAAEALLDQAWGRPMQPQELSGPGGVPLDLLRRMQAIHSMSDAELLATLERLQKSQDGAGNGKEKP